MLLLNIVGIAVTMFVILALFSLLYSISARETLSDKILAEARLLATNTAPMLAFHDNEEASKLVSSFQSINDLQRIVILDQNNTIFVDQANLETDSLPLPTPDRLALISTDTASFESNRLIALVPIYIENERMGTVVMVSGLDSIEKDILWFVGLGTFATIIGILISAFVLRKLQLWALAPLIEMSELAEQVATNKSYHLRAKVEGKDEFARLAHRLNQMLERIEIWDRDMLNEIDRRRESERHLDKLVRLDELTQLPNRLAFGEDLERSILEARLNNRSLVLMFIDLDDFKQVNDIHGHNCGDTVLQLTSTRLSNALRDTDRIYRLGGDEFAAILPGIEENQQALTLSKRMISAVAENLNLQGVSDNISIKIGASIGLAFFPYHASTTAGLLHKADIAMYAAKRSGKNSVQMFEQHMVATNEPSREP